MPCGTVIRWRANAGKIAAIVVVVVHILNPMGEKVVPGEARARLSCRFARGQNAEGEV